MNIQINNIHSTNSLSVIKVLSRIKNYDIVVIGSDIYEKGFNRDCQCGFQ